MMVPASPALGFKIILCTVSTVLYYIKKCLSVDMKGGQSGIIGASVVVSSCNN